MTDLTDLRTFVAVATSGSFTAVAKRLAVSPATVGRRISALEALHATKLIERTTRSHRLTEMGQAFLEKAIIVVEAADELDDLSRSEGTVLSGRVRVSGPTTLGIKRLSGLVVSFSEEQPGVSVELSLSDRHVDLVREGFDFAVRVGELKSASLVARRVGTYRFVCCAAPEYIERHGAPETPDALVASRCILNLNIVPRNRWLFIGADGTPFSVEVGGGVEIDNGEAQRAAALAGGGIIYAPRDLVADDLASGRLVPVLTDWDLLSLPIHIVYPSRRFVPRRVRALAETLAARLRE
ncbi:LysR family transcriptional regulator [Pelagibacterium xiamenense]|uniref:LysR family transcriptional regulator n=1 Tax=Pelagibacterium xiamenense TaxID=2901140 RepID=UPI001E5B5C1B|nr:LysR family transcriptional regulator [Pelagibacterium xiamenense]MCD7060272.1 LysR family transcriptional regulator [Pelagibacterium xiamenense]